MAVRSSLLYEGARDSGRSRLIWSGGARPCGRKEAAARAPLRRVRLVHTPRVRRCMRVRWRPGSAKAAKPVRSHSAGRSRRAVTYSAPRAARGMMRTAFAESGDSMMCPSPMHMATCVMARDGGSVAKKTRSPQPDAMDNARRCRRPREPHADEAKPRTNIRSFVNHSGCCVGVYPETAASFLAQAGSRAGRAASPAPVFRRASDRITKSLARRARADRRSRSR
jgi:hypothetical protein